MGCGRQAQPGARTPQRALFFPPCNLSLRVEPQRTMNGWPVAPTKGIQSHIRISELATSAFHRYNGHWFH